MDISYTVLVMTFIAAVAERRRGEERRAVVLSS